MTLLADASRPRRYIQRLSTVVVHAGTSSDAEALVRAATDVANLFGAKLIGISTPARLASLPMSEAEEEATELILENAACRFAKLSACVRAGVAWRPGPEAPALALQRFAWAADLIMVNLRDMVSSPERSAKLRALVTQSGRPVLVRPHGTGRAQFKRVVVVWDGSSACARAISAALPFLGGAEQIYVMVEEKRATARTRQALQRLREGLELRGIKIQTSVDRDVESDSASRLTPNDFDADLVVMGAWRLPKWLTFMDPTDSFIAGLKSFALLSH